MESKLEVQISKLLKKKKKTLAAAESCTGGLVSNLITNVPGSSSYFTGGVIAYSNKAKTSVLDVPSEKIKKHGAVSRQVALAMADGARRTLKSDIGVSITGIAGPGGGTKEKPVGLAYIALVSGKVKKSRKVKFSGSREVVKAKFAQAALKLVLAKCS